MTKILIASDHAGYSLKTALITYLKQESISFEDLGCPDLQSVDYPDYAKKVAEGVAGGKADFGVLVCGTGMGMSIAANKIKGIRAVTVSNLFTAGLVREHNNANVLCLGARVTTPDVAQEILRIFLNTSFAGARHEKRLKKISDIENQS